MQTLTVVLELSDELAAQFSRLPREDVNRYATAALTQIASRFTDEESSPVFPPRPLTPPDWVASLVPLNPANDGTNGMHRVYGAWPGDETDDEINAALEEMEREDVGEFTIGRGERA